MWEGMGASGGGREGAGEREGLGLGLVLGGK